MSIAPWQKRNDSSGGWKGGGRWGQARARGGGKGGGQGSGSAAMLVAGQETYGNSPHAHTEKRARRNSSWDDGNDDAGDE